MITTCGVLVIDKHSRILICHPTRHHPNQWDIVKGQVDDGENMKDAVRREFLEETGVSLDRVCTSLIDYSKMHDVEFVYKHKKKKLHGFIGLCEDTFDVAHFRCDSMVSGFEDLPSFPEVDAFAWVHLRDYMLLHESQQAFINHIWHNTKFLKNAEWGKVEKSHHYG